MRKFWNWIKNEDTGISTLCLNGVIAEESWFGDEVTPKLFKSELMNCTGDIEVQINSPGGDVVAAAQIYNMLMDFKGNVTVKIDGIAASAASVIAMAGTTVKMSPVSLMMIHNPLTVAIGDSEEMQKAIDMLSEVKQSIINAYEIKTGMSRLKISNLMDAETWMNAHKAVELGFADEIMYVDNNTSDETVTFAFSRRAVTNALLDKMVIKKATKTNKNQPSIEALKERLKFI
ncbi:MAG: head maturation protease, ClpP-related [Clostridium sp.]|uniref:head maturation protease, ClpP-related n=1 Tax=Clostridium sp. TaxID=1506 RepID=UPI0039E9E04D